MEGGQEKEKTRESKGRGMGAEGAWSRAILWETVDWIYKRR